MKSGFVDKLIDRMDRIDPGELQSYLLRLVRDKGFLENVFDALQEGVIVTDQDGRIDYINRAACELFGLDRKDANGALIRHKIRGLDWELLTRQGKVVSRDLEIFYPENRYVNFYLAPLNEEGVTGSRDSIRGGYVLLLRDITQNRQIELEKIESEKINALTMLAAGVAHEIGNPLNSLNIHLQLAERKLKKESDPELAQELGELLSISQDEIKRLNFIVERFLGAIRPSQPHLALADLNELISDSLTFLAPEIQNRDIEIIVELSDGVPLIPVDRDQMKQAFYNLIKNACQAIGNAGRLTVSTEADDYNVMIRFADTGGGISAADMGKIFQPYFTTKKAGSGLGLLIVRRIVREHGGEIEFESQDGVGTTVTIYLPRTEKRMRFLPEVSTTAAAATAGDAKKKKKVIDVELTPADDGAGPDQPTSSDSQP